MENQYDIFLSYSSKDQKYADCIYEKLTKNNIKVWYAPHHLKNGIYQKEIIKAIKASNKLLLLVSQNSQNSSDVENEITHGAKKEFIPVILDASTLNDFFDYHIRKYQFLNCQGLSLDELSARVTERVLFSINAHKPEPLRSKTSALQTKTKNYKKILPLLLSIILIPVLLLIFKNINYKSDLENQVAVSQKQEEKSNAKIKNDDLKNEQVSKPESAGESSSSKIIKEDSAPQSKTGQPQTYKDIATKSKKLFELGRLDEAKLLLIPFCEKGNGQACNSLAVLEEKRNNFPEESDLLEKACNLNFAPACTNLGIKAGEKNQLEHQERLYQKACGLNEIIGCSNLALILFEKKSFKESARYAGRACSKNHINSCYILGKAQKELGNTSGAKESIKKSCNLGNKEACEFYQEID